MRPTVMEVDIGAFRYNVEQVQKYVGNETKIMPVIKGNAYGTHINFKIEELEKFEIIAVAIVDEAIELRKLGYSKEIFVLNQPYVEEIEDIVKYDITIGICETRFIEELGKTNKGVKVHLEIDTGMGRNGIKPSDTKEFIKMIQSYGNINIEGIYTHFSSADNDLEYTKKQIEYFDNAIKDAKEILGNIKYIHCSASNGILNFPEKTYNLIRPGIILYGYNPNYATKGLINIKPVCKLKSKITFLKEVEPGSSIGYSRAFITNRKTKVATIPIGYADGLKREMSNKGLVIINGKKVPIIGNVCMDSFMADVTDLDCVQVGDDVYIWDNELVLLEDVAKNCNTTNYEILCSISNRVKRVFV